MLLIENPSRALATPIALGQLQRALNGALPDVVLSRIVADVERSGKIGPDERAFLDEAFAEQRAKKEPFSFADLVERRSTAAGTVAVSGAATLRSNGELSVGGSVGGATTLVTVGNATLAPLTSGGALTLSATNAAVNGRHSERFGS